MYGVLVAGLAILIQQFNYVPGEPTDNGPSSQRKLISMINNSHVNREKVGNNSFGRVFYINALTAFLFQLCYVIAYRRCRKHRLRFALIVASVALCITAALDNETVCALNPLLCSPMMIVSYYLDFKIFIITLFVPSVFGFLGTMVAIKGFRRVLSSEDEEGETSDNLQMIQPKKMVFEL